ncbi:hypothetical protein O9929_05610 [Vibrio lentus]|nr:hypothetical protein [Vibrio lentus]
MFLGIGVALITLVAFIKYSVIVIPQTLLGEIDARQAFACWLNHVIQATKELH